MGRNEHVSGTGQDHRYTRSNVFDDGSSEPVGQCEDGIDDGHTDCSIGIVVCPFSEMDALHHCALSNTTAIESHFSLRLGLAYSALCFT